MKKAIFSLIFVVALFAGTGGGANAAAVNKQKIVTSEAKDRQGLSLTIYNVNLGLVKDRREIKLGRGTGEVRFMDVAAKIIPTSVHIKSLEVDGGFKVLEQNYEYDLLNPKKLLNKYVGKEVKLFSKNPYTEREEVVKATLLSNNGEPIFRIGDEITFGHPGRVIFPEIPENLISRPTLVWLIESSNRASQKIEASYLTDGINWRADYVINLNKKDDRADILGWVSIDNKSGAVFKNTRLKLIAGDVQRVEEKRRVRDRLAYRAASAETAPQFKEEAFFEYHIYTLQRVTTIKNNQTKQVKFVTADGIAVKKELLFKGGGYYYRSRYGEIGREQKVGVFIEIENKKETGLGLPLPKGLARVYKNDNDGSLQFIGEDRIDHTPKDEKIRIKVGDAFDVVGRRKQVSWKKIASDTYEAGYEVSLRNHKNEDVFVKVVEPIPGDWRMLRSSFKFTKTGAHAAEFNIKVPKDKEVKLKYRVRMRF